MVVQHQTGSKTKHLYTRSAYWTTPAGDTFLRWYAGYFSGGKCVTEKQDSAMLAANVLKLYVMV